MKSSSLASLLAGSAVLALTACSVAPPPVSPSRAAAAPVPRLPSGAVPTLAPGHRHLLLVMVDGLPVRLFDRAMDAGVLPRLATLLASRPTVRATALSTFPSSTSPSVPEMLSGVYDRMPDPPLPGAVHAFDRDRRRVIRYLTEPDAWEWPVPDLFDAAVAAHLPSVTVFEGRWSGPTSILTRGANLRDAALELLGIESYNGDRGPVAHLLRRLEAGDRPAVTFLVFNAVDLAGHFHGPDSPEALAAIADVDRLLGRLLDTLSRLPGEGGRSLLDETTLLLFGDHGMVPSGTYLNLQPFFQRLGLSTFDASSVSQILFRERLGRWWARWPDVLLVAGGSNVTQIYLREPSGGWSEGDPGPPEKARKVARRPDDEALARAIAEQPGVAQVLRRLEDPERVELRASGGRLAWVVPRSEGRGRTYAYVVPDEADGDPLDYLSDPAVAPLVCRVSALLDRCFRDLEGWQRATAGARFPAAVPLLPKALRPARFTGDLVVTALPGYSFLRGQKGDHGNLERQAMTTPFLLNGPGIVAGGAVPFVRLVDLYPTAAVLLGADPVDPALVDLDGHPLPCVRPPRRDTLTATAGK